MLTLTTRCFCSALSRRPACASSIAVGLLSLSLSGCGDSPAETTVAQNDAAPPAAADGDSSGSSAPQRSPEADSGSQGGSEAGAGGFDSANMSYDGGYPGADGGGYPGGDDTDPAMELAEGYGSEGGYPGGEGGYPGAEGGTDPAEIDPAQGGP